MSRRPKHSKNEVVALKEEEEEYMALQISLHCFNISYFSVC
jgi:hypothetical protein